MQATPSLSDDWLQRLLPEHLIARSSAWPPDRPSDEPVAAHAAVLLVDVVGFTALTLHYAHQSPSGVEALVVRMQRLFTAIESVVLAGGGDIQQFAGDSILALWHCDEQALPAAILRALHAAGAVHEQVGLIERDETKPLQLRIGIAAGPVTHHLLGGVDRRWCPVCVGPPISTVGQAVALAPPGGTLCDGAAWRSVTQGAGASTGDEFPAFVPPTEPYRLPLAPLHASALPVCVPGAAAMNLTPWRVLGLLVDLDPVASTELRTVSCVFIQLLPQERMPQANALHALLQSALHAVQTVLLRFSGLLARASADDKGLTVLAVWGTPGHMHPDDAARALEAALSSVDALQALGLPAQAGVATGRALAGTAGGQRRLEYTVNGPAVNRAAKLMLQGVGDVGCDTATCDLASAGYSFRADAQDAAGSAEAARWRVARAQRLSAHDMAREPWGGERARTPLKLPALAQVERLFDKLARRDKHVLLVHGPAGIGKSTLVDCIVARSRANAVLVLLGQASDIAAAQPYHVWRHLLPQTLNLPADATPQTQREALDRCLTGEPELRDWLPVLNDFAALAFEESALTLGAALQARSDALRRVLAVVLAQASAGRSLLLVLEDAHWSDSLSWQLACFLLEAVEGCCCVVSDRGGDDGQDSLRLPESGPSNERVALGALSVQEVGELVAQQLLAEAADEPLVRQVWGASSGHPLFAVELTRSLREQGLVIVRDGLARLATRDAAEHSMLNMPPSVQAVILQRLDRLPPGERAALRVLSVAGAQAATHAPPEIQGALNAPGPDGPLPQAQRLGLVRAAAGSDAPGWQFSHGIVRDVVYASVAHLERIRMHRAMGLWLGHAQRDDLAATVAFHCSRADQPVRALAAVLHAGAVALRRYANEEAIRWLRQAIELMHANVAPANAVRLAECHRMLGYAYANLGDMQQAEQHLMLSFDASTKPHPQSGAGLWWAIAREGVRLVLRRPLARRRLRQSRLERLPQVLFSDALALVRLSEIAYFNWDAPRFLYAGLRGINHAESTGDADSLALWYVATAGIASSMRLARVAARYVADGLSIAARTQDSQLLARVHTYAAVNESGQGRFDAALRHCAQALHHSRRCDDPRRLEDGLICTSVIQAALGLYDQAWQVLEECRSRSLARGDDQTAGWAYLGIGEVHLMRRQPEAAMAALRQSRQRITDHLSIINLLGHLALAHWMLGSVEQAEHEALACIKASAGSPTSASVYVGIVNATQVLLELWRRAQPGAAQEAARRREADFRRGLQRLSGLAALFPIARPMCNLFRAAALDATGSRPRALRALRRAAAQAGALQMNMEHDAAQRLLQRWVADRHAPMDIQAAGSCAALRPQLALLVSGRV